MSIKSEYKPKTVKVYDLDEFEKLLKGIHVAACMITEHSRQIVDEASVIRQVSALTLGGHNSGDQCSCCGAGPFTSRAQQTAHYKHHWHTYNLKRKLFGKPSLSLKDFNSRQDDNSSVSGSDSESEVYPNASSPGTDLFAAATRHCKAFFTNTKGQVFCIYRCILHHKKENLASDGDSQLWVNRCKNLTLPGRLRWAVLMISGGHFAGAVFTGCAPVVHKTLHAYVVRRGQGQAQSTRDGHGNAPKSAGASLRRYNQAQFAQHVQDVLISWSEHLNGCSLILYRAVGPVNQGIFFGKGTPLKKDDLRVRVMPFPTKKPSFKEVQRVHATVANVEVYDTMELFQKALIATVAKPAPKQTTEVDRPSRKKTTPTRPVDRAKSREPMQRELPTDIVSSEDDGPCYIDSETPKGWIRTLSEQSKNGVISNSRKDLLIDVHIVAPQSSDSETENIPESKLQPKKERKKKEKKPEDNKNVKKGTQKIHAKIKKMWTQINEKDLMTLDTIIEEWECEVGILEACNLADPSDGNTALHKAAIAEKPEMVMAILKAGGDPCVRNHLLQTPYAATPHHDTRVAFRLFQASFPDKYNYAKSQIPGPITPEQIEIEREKKAQQKRAKRQRDKEKQVEKTKSSKFLQMTDIQKVRAVVQHQRCFLCGIQLPRDNFEYEDYKFCSIQCLQNHRNLRPLHLPA